MIEFQQKNYNHFLLYFCYFFYLLNGKSVDKFQNFYNLSRGKYLQIVVKKSRRNQRLTRIHLTEINLFL